MIRLNFEGRAVAVPGDVLAREVMRALPDWLTGAQAPGGQQAMIRSAVKAVIPMLLAMIHRDIVARGAPVAPPDLRCPAAKADIVGYAVGYMLGTVGRLADNELYLVEGEERDGVFIVARLVPVAPVLVAAGAEADAATQAAASAGGPAR
jgi:hypothetical protein